LIAGGGENLFNITAVAVFTADGINGGGNQHQTFKSLIAVIALEFIDWHFDILW
jgi:hypothetical protein